MTTYHIINDKKAGFPKFLHPLIASFLHATVLHKIARCHRIFTHEKLLEATAFLTSFHCACGDLRSDIETLYMALAIAKAAPLKREIKLSQALSDYEAILSVEQKQIFQKSLPNSSAVMALTCEIDRQNAGRKTRRCGARLTTFLNSVKGFTTIVDLIIGSSGSLIAGAVWGVVKTAIQVGLFKAKSLNVSLTAYNLFLTAVSSAPSYIGIHRLHQALKLISTPCRSC